MSEEVKVSQLPETETINDDDILMIVQNNVNKKIKRKYITNQYKVKLSDSFETIQNYFNDIRPKIIEFETGEYNFNNAFRLTANTEILLNNSNLIFNIPKVTEDWENSHGFYNFKRDDEFLEYNGNGNIIVIGGTITHGNFSFCHAKNITFKNINFELCNNDHVLEMCGINGLLVENCVFNGHSTNTTNYKECIQIDNATRNNFPFFENENNPTYDNTTNKNWIIRNNEFKNPNVEGYTLYNCIGMHTVVNNYYHENIIIENNYFNNSTNLSMQIINAKNVKIRNNNFYCNNASAISNEGSHIRTRSSFDGLFIENNIFEGNLKAIENITTDNLYKNLYIKNNTFKNYTNNVQNLSFINLYSVDLCYIINNMFVNFGTGVIRTNYKTTNSNNKYFIINNSFVTNLTSPIQANIIKPYDGYSWIINNNFDIPECLNSGCIYLSSDSSKVYAYKNNYNAYLVENKKTLIFSSYNKSKKDIENVLDAWSGDSATLTSENIIGEFANYKKMVLTLGNTNATTSIIINSWNASSQRYLDARTYVVPVSSGFIKFTINNDNTFSYDNNGTYIALRNIVLYND